MYDVIVVGGGHVGLYTASRLAQLGYHVLLLEKKKAIGEQVICTGIISTEAFQKFDLPEHTVISTIRKTRFFSPSGKHFDYNPPEPLARVVDRTKFNKAFADRARGHGAEILTDTKIHKVRIKKEGVVVKASVSEGHEQTFSSKLLILATGVNYKLFGSVGLEAPRNFLSGAQMHIPYPHEDWISIFAGREIAPGAFAWVVPLGTGVARIGLLSEQQPVFYIKRVLDRVRPGWRDDFSESQIDIRPVVQGPLDKTVNDRVMVVGEAAGQIKTTIGGGIYYGLLGADLAVETVKKSFLRNRFSADILFPYDKQWKKKIGDELRFGYYCRKFFAKLSDPQIEEFFERMLQQEILNVAYRDAAFDWHKGVILSVFKLRGVRRLLLNPF